MLRVRRLIQAGKVPSAGKPRSTWRWAGRRGGLPHRGTVNFIDNQVDRFSGTLASARVSKLRPPVLPRHVRAGPGAGRTAHQAILVSEAALGSDQGQKYCTSWTTRTRSPTGAWKPARWKRTAGDRERIEDGGTGGHQRPAARASGRDGGAEERGDDRRRARHALLAGPAAKPEAPASPRPTPDGRPKPVEGRP